jgi:copper transport protein
LEARPAQDAVVTPAPSEVVLAFSEPVETALGAIRVFAPDGTRVDDGAISRPAANAVATQLGNGLTDGTYTVAWRVVSADSHPVHGAFVFHIGAPGENPEGIAREVLASSDAPRSVSIGFSAVRFLSLGLTLLAVGGVVALVLVLTSADRPVRRTLLTVLAGLAAALGIVSLAGVVFQGAEASGLSLGAALDWSVIRSVADTRFGQVSIARALVAASLAVLLLAARRRATDSRGLLDFALVLCVGIVLAPAASGHANVSGALSFVADVVHVQAASIWVGGLALLALGLALARGRRWELATDAVPRFSQLALIAVSALLVAGIVNAYLQVRTWSGLWETTYGRLLLVKITLLLPLIALGAYNRFRTVPPIAAQRNAPGTRRGFLRSTGIELGLMVAVVAVTAALVSQPPARAVVAPSGPVTVSAALGDLDLELVVDPARAGGNAIHLYLLDATGRPAEVDEVRLSARLPSQGLGPLRATARRITIGHFAVYGFDFPLPGDWELLVEARRGEFESLSARFPVRIGQAG